jgi:branched-chain amino acid transport system substrate-binding protein
MNFYRRVKRIIFIFLIGMILIFSACSNPTSSDQTGQPSSEGTSEGTKEGNVIKLGMSFPMSGAAASWGITAEWVAKQAVKYFNDQGGVTVDGKKYTFELFAYDNKYNSAEGARVAQKLVNHDKVDFIIGSLGSAPVMALQALTEPAKIIHFTVAASSEIKGPKYPYTFTTLNTPVEVVEPLFSYILSNYPDAKKVAIINPNDATGTDTAKISQEVWKNKGVYVVANEFYERGTTEFSQIVTKLINNKPDIVDLGSSAPGDAGLILRALKEQGWDGIKVLVAGTSAKQLLDTAGEAEEGVFLGQAPDFEGENATDIQRELAKRMKEEINEELNVAALPLWDAIVILKTALEKAGTFDPDKLREVIPTLVYESSYGKAVFGGELYYGTPRQLLLPVAVTQIQNGKPVELDRVIPSELKEKLKENIG